MPSSYPSRDLTNQYISLSYQDVVQKYSPDAGDPNEYFLDGLGNVIVAIPSSSIGNILITSDVTSSMVVLSASYSDISSLANVALITDIALSASIAETASFAFTASYFSSISGSNLLYLQCTDGNTYPVSLDVDSGSIRLTVGQTPVTGTNNFLNIGTVTIPNPSASWASSSISSSYAELATSSSYAESASWAPMPAIPSTDSASWASSSVSASYVPNLYPQTEQISASWSSASLSASYVPNLYPQIEQESASWASSSISSSIADSASYIIPGATFMVVSGSNGIPPAYIEPYDYSPLEQIYQPPYKAGRIFWDNRYNDWAWYCATGSGATSWRFHLGKEVDVGVRNPYNVTLPRLSVVYVGTSSVAGDYHVPVYLAQADGTGQHASILGVVRNDIPSGSTGFVMTNGVMHRTNMGTFQVGDKLWLSTTVPGGMTTEKPGQPYEQVLVGYCSEAGVLGSFICRQSTFPPPPNAYAGMTSVVTVTNNNDGTVTVSTGSVNLYDDASGVGIITPYPLPETILTLVTGSTNYIIAERSGSSLIAQYQITTNQIGINNISIVPVSAIDPREKEPGNWELHEFDFIEFGLALANKLQLKDNALHGIEKQYGFTLFTTGSETDFGITEGSAWWGTTLQSMGEVISSKTESCDTYHYISSASVWTYTTGSGYDNGHYNEEGGLSPLTSNSWSVNFIYRIAGAQTDCAIILGNNQYENSTTAQTAEQPPNLPSFIDDMGILVGRFIVQSGSTNPIIQSSFSTVFAASQVTQHNSLLGIQGGQGGEYYHFTKEEHDGTGTGVLVYNNKPSFQGATPYHIPYWKSDQTLTLTGSIQVYNDQYVLVNSGSPDPTNPEALLVLQKNSSSVNCIAGYGEVDNFLQINISNITGSENASSDFVATNDIGSVDEHYIDMGINSSGYNNPDYTVQDANGGYIYVNSGSLAIGTQTEGEIIKLHTDGTTIDKLRAYIDDTGLHASGSLYGTASHAESASWAPQPVVPDSVPSASWASSSISSSYAESASWATTASYVLPNIATYTSSYLLQFRKGIFAMTLDT